MKQGKGASIMEYFGALEDPRIDRCKQHQLLDIVAIAICAVIYVEMFGKSKEEWFRTFLDLPNGIPSHDTFGDVFSRLDPDRFQECFMEWSQAVADLLPGEVVARRQNGAPLPRQPGRQAAHPPGQRLGLGQHPDPGTGEDGGEIQRNHRHTPAAGVAGVAWVHSNH